MLLVTGATGHSGQWFIRKLAKEGYSKPIRCTIRPKNNLDTLKTSGLTIEYVQGNMEDPQFAMKALDGISIIVNFAGIECAKAIIPACQKQNVQWAILVHTTGRYSQFKAAAQRYIEIEEWVLKSGFNTTIVRPTMIYGSSMDRNIWKLVDFLHRFKFFPVFGDGKNLMQPIHARDLGEAIYAILINQTITQGRAYNLAGKNPITYFNLVSTVAKTLNRKVYFVKIPYALCIWGAKIYGLLVKRPVISEEQVMRMKEDKIFDYSEATRDFGYTPIDFPQGIREEVKEYLGLHSGVGDMSSSHFNVSES